MAPGKGGSTTGTAFVPAVSGDVLYVARSRVRAWNDVSGLSWQVGAPTAERVTFLHYRPRLRACRDGARQQQGRRAKACRPGVGRPRVWRLGVACTVVCALAASLGDAAATSQPATAPATANYLHLDYFQGDVQIESRYDWRRVKDRPRGPAYGRPGYRQRNTLLGFEETLGLRLEGDVVDPGFLRFDVGLRFGLDQQRAVEQRDGMDRRDNDAGWLAEYDVRVDLFSNKPFSAAFYAEREDDRISRLFLPSLRHDRTRVGVMGQWVTDRTTMRLTLEETRDDYDGRADTFDNEDLRERIARVESEFELGEHHELRIDAEYGRLRENYAGSAREFAATRSHLDVSDVILFGSTQQHRLETMLYYQEEQGDLAFDLLEVGPQLKLTHSDSLQTQYKYQFNRYSFEGVTVRTHRGDFDVQHDWRDALTTTVELFGQHQESDENDEIWNAGGSVHWNYRRPNRWGRFSANLGYWYDYERFRQDRGTQVVVNESHRLRDPLPAFLNRPNVIPASVVVTSVDRRRVFIRGSDYVIVRRHGRTALMRLPFGRIADGDSVLAHYLYAANDGRNTQTHEISARIQQDFKNGLTPYYAVTFREQRLSESDPLGFEPNRLNRHRLGLTYRRPTWSAGTEFEINDETIEPYTAGHFSADWQALKQPPHQLDLRVRFSQFCFRQFVDRDASLFDVGLDYRHEFNSQASFRTAVAYRFEHDTTNGDTHGVDVQSELAYRIGQLTLSMAVEYDALRIASSDDDGVSIWFKVRREFPDLLRRR